ncbi:MAG: DUF2059 domain-containing protein [Spirochaetaceae bacterium]|nr:DUF2059 domain-containing protein [Spirochaetaceae bacterium]
MAVIFVFFAVACFSQAKATEKKKDIVRLLELTNTKELSIQIFDMMIPQLSQAAPTVPGDFWDLMRQKLDLDDFVSLYIGIYDRHFSHEEIKDLIKFYESPIGKRLIQETPSITRDSMTAGQEWGMRLGMKIMQELKKGGYLDT